ncbi:MAG: uncharacterized membrane protein (UPF0127 family) [Urechidicola sp.]|jgi:uncharacterized membrane protein (UPF0127 family)
MLDINMRNLLKVPLRMIYSILAILFSSFQSLWATEITFNTTMLAINKEVYSIEIAKTQDQRQQGLMFRDKLGSKNGMVFIYPNSARHRIWMKNTIIKLTVLWIDKGGQVLGIQRLEPCQRDPCKSYGLNQPSKYIIELNHQAHNIKIGDEISGLNQL